LYQTAILQKKGYMKIYGYILYINIYVYIYIYTSGYPACATMLKKEIHFVYLLEKKEILFIY